MQKKGFWPVIEGIILLTLKRKEKNIKLKISFLKTLKKIKKIIYKKILKVFKKKLNFAKKKRFYY